MLKISQIGVTLFISLISLVEGQVFFNGNELISTVVGPTNNYQDVWGGEVIGPIPDSMASLKMFYTTSNETFSAGSELKLSCQVGKKYAGCEFFVSFHHCNPKSCSSQINGGLPALLGADGWIGAPCAPKFSVSGVGGYPMTTLRKEVLSGYKDTITTSENLKYFVVFQRLRVIDCAPLDESSCDSAAECLWRFGRCSSKYCPRSSLPSTPPPTCKCVLASPPECKKTRSPKGYKGVCQAGVSCTNVVCAKNYSGKPVVTCKAAGQAFRFKGCKKVGKVCKRTRSPKGYIGVCPKGPSCEKIIKCAKGYKGTAIVKCPKSDSKFIFTGCREIETGCKRTRSPKGYTGVCPKGPTCTGIRCAKNYSGIAIAKCPGKNKLFKFSGCKASDIDGCVRTKSPPGYIGVCPAGPKCTRAIRCKKNYTGKPVVKCPGKGKKFEFSGCTKTGSSDKGCVRTKSPQGYIGVCPAGSQCGGRIRCKKNFVGSPTVTCPGSGKSFHFAGCTKSGAGIGGSGGAGSQGSPSCVATNSPVGYDGVCPAGRQCTNIRCSSGYLGSPVVRCTGNGYNFVFSGCMKGQASGLKCCPTIPPLGYLGYCPAGLSCNGKVRCAMGYTGNPVTSCPGQGKRFQFTGCRRAASSSLGKCCPTKAPGGYLGFCPSGTSCPFVKCAFGYTGRPQVKCPGGNKPFVFFGCVKRG